MSDKKTNGHLEVLAPDKTLPPVNIDEPQITDADANEALKTLGLVNVSADKMHALSVLGQFGKGTGFVRNQRGQAFMTQARVDQAMSIMVDVISGKLKVKGKTPSFDQMVRSASTISVLARASTDSQRLILEIEGFLPPGERSDRELADGERKKSFAPGQNIQPHTTIYAQKVDIAAPTESK